MFQLINCRNIAVTVRARGETLLSPKRVKLIIPDSIIASLDFFKSMNHEKLHKAFPKALNILEQVNSTNFRGDKGFLSTELSRICSDVLEHGASDVGPVSLSRMVSDCSSLGILDKKMVRLCTDRIRSLTAGKTSYSENLVKCCLVLWSVSLWNGLNTNRVVEIMMSGIVNSLFENPPSDWLILGRLAWCIESDPLTRYDPSLKARLSAIITERVAPLTVMEMCSMLRNDSAEFIPIKKSIYERLIAAVEQDPEGLLVSRATDVPCRVLEAWSEMRLTPPSLELIKRIVNRCTRPGGASVDRVLHCLCVLNYPRLDSTLDTHRLKEFLFSLPEWKPNLNQVSTLCAAFPVLGLLDIESTTFLAGQLNRVLGDSTTKFSPSDSRVMWQIGFWYAHLQRSASETTLAAINDIFRPLMVRIASNMWDKQGLFVRREDPHSLHPAERAVRTIVNDSLLSLGISAMKNVHIVNTPFVMPLYLQERNLGILFVREGDQVLSDGRYIGTVETMKSVIESHGLQVRILNVAEYDRAFDELSSDNFMEKLLRDIQ